MVFNFNFNSDIFNSFTFNLITLNIYIYNQDNTLIDQRSINSPFDMARLQYLQLIQQLAEIQQPIKMVCSTTKSLQLNNGDIVEKPCTIIYYNNYWNKPFE